jgi:hypothetical protein
MPSSASRRLGRSLTIRLSLVANSLPRRNTRPRTPRSPVRADSSRGRPPGSGQSSFFQPEPQHLQYRVTPIIEYIETSAGDVIGRTVEGKIVRFYSAEVTFHRPPPPRLLDEGHVAVRATAIHRVLAARAVQLHSLRHVMFKRENIPATSGRTGGVVGHLVNRRAAERTSESSSSRWYWMRFLLENLHVRQCNLCNMWRQFAVILNPTLHRY